MKKEWTNRENLEFTINKLNEIIEEWGNINISSETYRKFEFKKLHKTYDKLFELRKKLQKRLKEEEECIMDKLES